MRWTWKKFSELTLDELYALIAVREEVFVEEQKLTYIDADGLDKKAWHLLGFEGEELVAYLRAFAPGVKGENASLGRVLTIPSARGKGLGRAVIAEGLARMEGEFGPCAVEISAQAHLEKLYRDFGFMPVGDVYLEVGIKHLHMVRNAYLDG